MGHRRIIIKESVAESIAAIAWYIESKGLVTTAEKFSDHVYNYFIKLPIQEDHILRAGMLKEHL